MKKLLVAIVIAATGCSQLKENPEIKFEVRTLRVESQSGCDADTATCASFEVNYPVFDRLDTTIEISINERIAALLNPTPDGTMKSFQELGDDFIADFNQFVTQSPEFGFGWYWSSNVNVLIASDTLISLQVDTETFTGGAHGSYTTRFVNVDPLTGTEYLLDALLKVGYEDELNRLAYEDLQAQHDYEQTEQPSQTSEDTFKLNDNYGFRKEGIVFFFNTYEIGSYAEGPTEILIPYERLTDWIK